MDHSAGKPREIRAATVIAAITVVAFMGMALRPATAQCGFDSGIRGTAAPAPPATTNATPGLPAVHSYGIHQDSPTERDEMLKMRSATKTPQEVPPLKAQTITPAAPASR
jgi:hypothetical protein